MQIIGGSMNAELLQILLGLSFLGIYWTSKLLLIKPVQDRMTTWLKDPQKYAEDRRSYIIERNKKISLVGEWSQEDDVGFIYEKCKKSEYK